MIIASGRFGNPYLPQIPGAETFEGRYMHARDFTAPEPFAGQRVLVVGNGPSGVDIAAALDRGRAQSGAAGDPQRHRDRARVSLRAADRRLGHDRAAAAESVAQARSSTA